MWVGSSNCRERGGHDGTPVHARVLRLLLDQDHILWLSISACCSVCVRACVRACVCVCVRDREREREREREKERDNIVCRWRVGT